MGKEYDIEHYKRQSNMLLEQNRILEKQNELLKEFIIHLLQI